MRRRLGLIKKNTLPDFSGFGITRLYAPFKTNLATSNTYATLKRPLSAANPTITYGSDGIANISVDNYNYYYENIYCQITGHSVYAYAPSTEANQWCQATIGTTPITKNGLPAYRFLASTYGGGLNGVQGTALSELDLGNDFSIILAVSSESTADSQAVLSTYDNSGVGVDSRIAMYCDRRSNKLHSNIKTDDNTVNRCELDSQLDTSDTRVLVLTVNGTTGLMTPYLNGVAQTDTETYSGTYKNTVFQLGNQLQNATPLDGYLQTAIVCNKELNSTEASNITSKINEILGL